MPMPMVKMVMTHRRLMPEDEVIVVVVTAVAVAHHQHQHHHRLLSAMAQGMLIDIMAAARGCSH